MMRNYYLPCNIVESELDYVCVILCITGNFPKHSDFDSEQRRPLVAINRFFQTVRFKEPVKF